MAYVEGEPLSTRLKEAGRLGVAETMSIVAQAADALHAAHQNGTVHRDVKPGNLIVKPNGAVDPGRLRGGPVGRGDQRDRAERDRRHRPLHGARAGRQGQRHAGHRHLRAGRGGVPLHRRAARRSTGTTPCRSRCGTSTTSRTPLPDDVPAAVRELISQAMAKQPDDRFASAAEFADAALAASAPMD